MTHEELGRGTQIQQEYYNLEKFDTKLLDNMDLEIAKSVNWTDIDKDGPVYY